MWIRGSERIACKGVVILKKKIVIWGLGGTTRGFLTKKGLYRDCEIIAYTDNNPAYWHTKYEDVYVIEPFELKNIMYDYIVICSLYYEEIRKQLEQQLFVDSAKIVSYIDIEENLKKRLVKKYRLSQDNEVRDIVDYLERNSLNVYGNYISEKHPYLVYRDQDKHPYIIFEGKRMYYPDRYTFWEKDGRQFVSDVLYEQKEGSPHQYIRSAGDIRNDSVIVDAGVCEGNFALRYVEKAKKIYLIEADAPWMEALERTFRPYREKVVFCAKYLTRYDSKNTITLDSLVNEKIDFLKMDIEGAEIDALIGAKRTLVESNANCAICSYHKQNDEDNIRFLLEAYGYETSTSKGYMFFIHDENIADTLDLRRGIVYGKKHEGFSRVKG